MSALVVFSVQFAMTAHILKNDGPILFAQCDTKIVSPS